MPFCLSSALSLNHAMRRRMLDISSTNSHVSWSGSPAAGSRVACGGRGDQKKGEKSVQQKRPYPEPSRKRWETEKSYAPPCHALTNRVGLIISPSPAPLPTHVILMLRLQVKTCLASSCPLGKASSRISRPHPAPAGCRCHDSPRKGGPNQRRLPDRASP